DFVMALRSLMNVKLALVEYRQLADELDSPVKVFDEKKLSKKRKVALQTLRKINHHVVSILPSERGDDWLFRDKTRSVYLGELRKHPAWTDGSRSIGYNADMLVRSLESGFKG